MLALRSNAYSDEAGHAFQSEAGHLFRSEAGRDSDLMSATGCLLPRVGLNDVSDLRIGQAGVDFAGVDFAGVDIDGDGRLRRLSPLSSIR